MQVVKYYFALIINLFIVFNSFSQNLEPFMDSSGKYGYKNPAGKIVIQAKYEWVSNEFIEGIAQVKLNNLYGHINTDGKLLGRIEYENTSAFGNGLCAVYKNKKWGYINTLGKIVIDYKFERAGRFSENLAGVQLNKNDKFGFIDKTGKVAIEYKFDDVRWFTEGLAPFKINSTWGFIDKSGKIVIENLFTSVGRFSEDFANVQQGIKWGYINKSGGIVIPVKFDYAGEFSEGLAAVKLLKKWGYINKSGYQVIDFKYDYADAFKGNQANVLLLSNKFLIDKSGVEIKDTFIKPFEISFYNSIAMSIKDNTFGILLTNTKYFMKIKNFSTQTTKSMNICSPDSMRIGEDCEEYKSTSKDNEGFEVRLYHFRKHCQFEMSLNKTEILKLTNLLKGSEWKNIQTADKWQIWEYKGVLMKYPTPVAEGELFFGADFTMYKKPKN